MEMRHIHAAHNWAQSHRKHVLACLSFVAVVTHYIVPEYDAHVTALIGFVCVEYA
jgi:hypothetical protein